MKRSTLLFVMGLSLTLSCLLSGSVQAQAKAGTPQVPSNFLDLLRKNLKDGTPVEKENALDVIRDLKSLQLIPEVIEAIGDPIPLPRHGDTGWGFVGHQAATVLGEIAFAVDRMDVKTRGNGYDAYSFHNDQYKGGQALKELGRLTEVKNNWNEWWQKHGLDSSSKCNVR